MPRRRDRADRTGDQVGNASETPAEPLINRVLELDLLLGHINRVRESGSGHAVLMLGESGIGKSRLAQEAQKKAVEAGMKAMAVQCLGTGSEPLLPFKEGLAAYLGHSPDSIRRTLAGAAPLLLDAIPFIGAFLGRVGEKLSEGRGGVSMKGVYEELARILVKVAGDSGLFLLIEDLHAADSDTLHFTNYLLHKIKKYPVLVVTTIQEEQLNEHPPLADMVAQWAADGYATLTVVPLERAHVGEYVQQMADTGAPADEETTERLFRLTGGNPFFMREALNLITQDPGRQSSAEVVPPRTDAILRRRLARADDETLHFLRAAAVVLVTSQDLEPVRYVMEADTRSSIEALGKARSLRLMRESPTGEISFVHSLMQREVYAAMGTNQRRYMHERAAEWFAANESLASASYHYEQAGRVEEMVQAALKAASRAEQSGMYHTALMLYQKVRPHMRIEDLGPRLGRALIVLGDWDQAEQLAERLPIGDSQVRLLRSELRFVRGDFDGAKSEAEMALMGTSADRVQVLIRLADIELYLGNFSSAQRYGHAALEIADESGTPSLRARCLGIIAATEFFGGSVNEARERFLTCENLLREIPEKDRDRTLLTVILGNLGDVAETQRDWAAAERYHREALQLRREIADARGALHSLHALGRARLGAGDREGAERYIAEAEEFAADLNETLERAKIRQTRGELALSDGNYHSAQTLVEQSLRSFSESRTGYDVAHARLALSNAYMAGGEERKAVEQGAIGRCLVDAMGYGLLRRKYRDITYDLSGRIAASLSAYALGDALGLPWENTTQTDLTADEIEQLPARGDWPRAATSDDTALTLLTAWHLAERDGHSDVRAFLRDLAERAPAIRGLGPSTTAAIDHFRQTGELPSQGGATNGAPMRALPIGWVIPHANHERRRQLAREMASATHPDPSTVVAACVMATCASWALEGASGRLLLEVATEEARDAARAVGAEPDLARTLTALSQGRWDPPAQGVGLDPSETVAAVLSVVGTARSLREALIRAVQLRGDTDTVAALVGGLLGARLTLDQVRAELPWNGAVLSSELRQEINDVAVGLATARIALSAPA